VQALQVIVARRKRNARRREERGRVIISEEVAVVKELTEGERTRKQDFDGRRFLFRTFLSD